MSGLTLALIAVALSPLAYWILGPDQGTSKRGSSIWFRRFVTVAYFASMAGALWETFG